jgi:hypothetical protein
VMAFSQMPQIIPFRASTISSFLTQQLVRSIGLSIRKNASFQHLQTTYLRRLPPHPLLDTQAQALKLPISYLFHLLHPRTHPRLHLQHQYDQRSNHLFHHHRLDLGVLQNLSLPSLRRKNNIGLSILLLKHM